MNIVASPLGVNQAPPGPGMPGSLARTSPVLIDASIVNTADFDLRRLDALSRRFQLQGVSRSLLPDYRVSNCLRYMAGSLVEVYHHAEHSTATYGGLQTCGSVHVCPCCGSKIAERRADEITAGVSTWSERGGSIVMATFTLQHTADDTLQSLGEALNEAYRYIRRGRPWGLFERRIGLVGSITAREYTYGNGTGWHPHLHALLFCNKLSLRKAGEMQKWLRSAWSSAVAKFNRYAHPLAGVHLRLGDSAAGEYVSKSSRAWTVADELAKANRKLGLGKLRYTPQQLLWLSGLGVAGAGERFQEYAAWTFRKNALVWSPGLRKLLGLVDEEKTDEEVAGELVAGGRLFVQFDRQQWRVILANDARAELLLVAGAGEVEKVAEFVAMFGLELHPLQLAEVA